MIIATEMTLHSSCCLFDSLDIPAPPPPSQEIPPYYTNITKN